MYENSSGEAQSSRGLYFTLLFLIIFKKACSSAQWDMKCQSIPAELYLSGMAGTRLFPRTGFYTTDDNFHLVAHIVIMLRTLRAYKEHLKVISVPKEF